METGTHRSFQRKQEIKELAGHSLEKINAAIESHRKQEESRENDKLQQFYSNLLTK